VTRTLILFAVLTLALVLNWMGTLYIYATLPERLPMGFGSENPYDRTGPKSDIFFFPLLVSGTAILVTAFYPLRRTFYFPGKSRLEKIPEEVRWLIYDRVYQVVLVVGIFIVFFFSYIQVSIILYSIDAVGEMRAWPLLPALLIMALYVAFNLFWINKMITYVIENKDG
jgi:hypothetical protein